MRDLTFLTRRRFLTTTLTVATTLELQRAAMALGLANDSQVCRLAAEQEVGPNYVPDELLRSNIVEDKVGVPLSLRIAVLDSRTCKPLLGAAVDIWHCDALGVYSGFAKQSLMGSAGLPPGFDPQHPDNPAGKPPGPPPVGSMGSDGRPMGQPWGPPPENHPSDKLTFLRGIQMTGADGAVRFQTVFPGFYMGRTNHIHFKVRLQGHISGKSYAEGHTSHVGQVFFPEDLAVKLMEHEPYARHKIHRTTQAEDEVFGDQHGDLSIAQISPLSKGVGYQAELVAAVDPTATPAPAERQFGPGGPNGPGGQSPTR